MKEKNTNTEAAPAMQGAIKVTAVELLRLSNACDLVTLECEKASMYYEQGGHVDTARLLRNRAHCERELSHALRQLASQAAYFALIPLDAVQAGRMP